MIARPSPRLADGYTMPEKPVYWLIWVLDEAGRPYSNRCCWAKVLTPREASRNAYGMDPTENMRFFPLTSRLEESQVLVTKSGHLWLEARKEGLGKGKAKRFVIEHPTRGVFLGFDNSRTTGEWRPKFSWSISRTDPKVLWYYDVDQARRELAKIEKAGVKGCYTTSLV